MGTDMRRLVAIFMLLCGSAVAQIPVIPSGFNFPVTATGRPTITGFTATYIGTMDTAYLTNSSGVNPPANADSIQDWGDQSGNFRSLRQLGGSSIGPQYVTGAGGPPGGGPYLQFRANSNSDLTNKSFTKPQCTLVFLVARDLNQNSSCTINGSGDQLTQLSFSTPNLHMYAGTDVSVGPPPVSTWDVYSLVYSNTVSHFRTNGVDGLGALSIGTGGLNGLTVGAFFNGSGPSAMRAVELDIYNGITAPSATEIHAYEVYLGATYGITIH